MDVNELRIGVTVLSFIAFMGILTWAWSRRNTARFDAAAQLPFVESVDTGRPDGRNDAGAGGA